jgi:integrase
MERIKLTGTNLTALEAKFAGDGKADRIYWDTEITGFGLRFRSGGTRTWILQYKVHGADRRYTLGPYPGITAKTARAMAQDKLAEVWQGRDPQQAKRDAKARVQAQITLKTVIDNFLEYKQPPKLRPGSFREIKRYLDRDWDSLHGWPITEIKLANIASILDRLEKARGPVSTARARSALSSVFKWAMGRGYTDHNPVANSINPDNGKPRERVLSDAELSTLWNNCSDGSDYSRIIRLLILTACRIREIGGMAWSELNFDNYTWRIPAERTKNKREHILPLPHAFWKIIESVERRPGRDFLFGHSDRGYANWSDSKIALDKRSKVADWTHHDIRRTVATKMADSPEEEEQEKNSPPKNSPPTGLGIQPHIVEAVLNHVSGHKSGVAGIYNRANYQRQMKTALAMWADHVASIVSGEERKILPFPAETG